MVAFRTSRVSFASTRRKQFGMTRSEQSSSNSTQFTENGSKRFQNSWNANLAKTVYFTIISIRGKVRPYFVCSVPIGEGEPARAGQSQYSIPYSLKFAHQRCAKIRWGRMFFLGARKLEGVLV